MKIDTTFMGEVEVADDQIYTFEEGMYGFPDSKRFVFIGELSPEFPYLWMQSLDEQNTVFVVTNPFLFKENYDFVLTEANIDALGIKGIEEAMIYTAVVIPENVQNTTINLKSPIIVNLFNHKGKQVILNEDYPYKHYIFRGEEA